MKSVFKERIYKTGVNWCVDVPGEITTRLQAEKGYIRIIGTINGFPFSKSLVPVKNAPYRLYVNLVMMKGGKTALGEMAEFEIEQNNEKPVVVEYPLPAVVEKVLHEKNLTDRFQGLSVARKRDILRYLNMIKGKDTLDKNINKLVARLESGMKDVRIP